MGSISPTFTFKVDVDVDVFDAIDAIDAIDRMDFAFDSGFKVRIEGPSRSDFYRSAI